MSTEEKAPFTGGIVKCPVLCGKEGPQEEVVIPLEFFKNGTLKVKLHYAGRAKPVLRDDEPDLE
jgi:hypothetical protein